MEINLQKLVISISVLIGIVAQITILQVESFNSFITKSVVVACIGIIALLVSHIIDSEQIIKNASIVFAIVSVIVSILFVTITGLQPGSLIYVFILVLISLSLVGISHLIESDINIDNKYLYISLVVCIIILVSFITIDITMNNNLDSTVRISDNSTEDISNKMIRREELRIGTISITNTNLLPVKYDYERSTRVSGCIVGYNESKVSEDITQQEKQYELKREVQDVYIDYNEPDIISGTYKTDLFYQDSGLLDRYNISVNSVQYVESRTDCSASYNETTLLVYTESQN